MEQTKLLTKEQYQALKAAWKASKHHDAAEHIIYNILRSLPATKGFTPIAEDNLNKINSNQGDRWNGYNEARRTATWRFPRIRDSKMYDLVDLAKFKERWGIDYDEKYFELIKGLPYHG